jgi:hypothetical protein
MRKFALPLVLVASLGVSSIAMAATDSSVTGAIKTLDTKNHAVTLDNKTTYHFAKTIDLSTFKVGEKVTVTFHLYKKTDVGTKIAAAAAPAATTTTMAPKKS